MPTTRQKDRFEAGIHSQAHTRPRIHVRCIEHRAADVRCAIDAFFMVSSMVRCVMNKRFPLVFHKVFFCFRFVFSFRPVAAGGAGRGSKGQAPPFPVWRVVRLHVRPAKVHVTQPSLVGGSRRPCLRETPLVELYSGVPALTREVGCRRASKRLTGTSTKRRHHRERRRRLVGTPRHALQHPP
jgi:hypothetical protein